MFDPNRSTTLSGFSLIEVLVAVSLLVLVFTGLFAGLQLMIEIIGNSKAEAGARALAIERIEYIRSLDYYAVGTVAGIPAGALEQNATTSLNGVVYDVRTLVQYIDRPEDGFGAADGNGITEDSKVVKVTYSWDVRGNADSLTMITDLVPIGIESTAGGGTLLINVFDKAVQPVEGAEIRVINDSLSSPVDVTVTTNSAGVANFPGAPSGSNYQIWASKTGYSSDQTYSVTATNTSPIRSHISIATGTISTVNFQIDELSDLTIRTVGEPVSTTFLDTFASAGLLASSTDITVSGGALVAAGGPSSYAATSTAFSTTTTPATISRWESIDFSGTTTANSEYRVRLYSATEVGSSTVYSLVPDTDLALNSFGYVQGPVNITSVDPVTYPSLALGLTMTSSSSSETAELYDWQLTHVEDQPAISSIPFTLTGAKTIGTFGGAPVYKYSTSGTTDGSGEVAIGSLEYDDYDISLTTGSYDISEVYGGNPYTLEPGVTDTVTFVLSSPTTYSLRLEVEDDMGQPIGGATARLQNGGYDVSQDTSIYGQTYFSGGLSSSSAYTLDVTAAGYDPLSVSSLAITGNEQLNLSMVLAGAGGGGGGATTTPTSTSSYLAGYDTRLPISIAGTTLFGSVTDFPVYLDLSDLPASFFSSVQSDGDDIRVTSGDGLSEVPVELVSIDTGAETGQLFFRGTLDTSTTSVFYMYYGSSTASAYAASDTYGSQNVWSNGYKAVYHMEESVAGSGNLEAYRDSTSYEAHADDYIQDTSKFGVLGQGQRFEENTTDYMVLPHTILDGESDVTLSFWYATNNTNRRATLSGARGYSSSGDANEYLFWFWDRNELELFNNSGTRVHFGITNTNDWNWRLYTIVRDDTNNHTRLYINGTADNENPESQTLSTLSVLPGGLIFGADQDAVSTNPNDAFLDDDIDEIRISNTVRDSGWVANVYLNQNSPTSFYTIGSEETE